MGKQNKLVLITGATRGIGRALTVKLAEEMYGLLLVASNEAALYDLQADLKKEYPQLEVLTFQADLSDPEHIHRLCNWAQEHRPDILINNVGVFEPVTLLEEAEGTFLPQFYVNYYAAHSLCVAIGRQMRERMDGHIFNISSTASRKPVQAGAYTVTKFALRGLTSVLREELRDSGVKVTEIIPGSTRTSSWDGTELSEDRFVKSEEVAETIVFSLAMGESTMIEEIVIKPQKGNVLTDL